jgi:hypothetical protein
MSLFWLIYRLRIRRELKSGHLVPSGDMWPRFLFRNYEYNLADPWDGLLRSGLLVKVSAGRSSVGNGGTEVSANN